MEGLFHDRFSGRSFEQPPDGRTVLGRWQIRVPAGRSVFLNTVPVQSGDFLVPEPSGSWRVIDGEGLVREGKINRKFYPEDVEAESIRAMGRNLHELVRANATWRDWLKVVPLMPGMSDAVDPLPLENLLRRLFGHLESVCMKPRAHLHVEVERVPVARARRLPVKATAYLASHTEDWERPLIHGVLPKRILSEIRHDQVDIYENRVSARLIDHLVVYLGNRIRLIRKLLKVFKDKEDYSRAVGGFRLRQQRIFKLWGQSVDANEGRKRAEATLKELEWLKYRLLGLMDSLLYLAVPRRTYVAPTLRTTNILTNDQNYRRVAELWRAWVGSGHAKIKTPADFNREVQELCEGIGRFTLLLIVRALDQLGYEISVEDMESPVKTSGRWVLQGHGTEVVCRWDDTGKVSIEMGASRLTVVSIPACLGAAGSDGQVREVLKQALEAIDDTVVRTIVLYAGDSDEPGQRLSVLVRRQIYTVGNDPRAKLEDRIGFLPVSPWDIGSVERVSRAIRWFADSARFNSYPIMVKVCPQAKGVIDAKSAGTWLKTSDGGEEITIRRPPREHERNLLELDQFVNEARHEYEQAMTEHDRLAIELNEAVRKGRAGKLKFLTKNARQRMVSTEQRMVAVERLRDDLDHAFTEAKSLLVCPACGEAADPVKGFKARDKGCFRCDCQECGMRWATHLCKNQHRYAVMLPGDFVETDDDTSGWEDRIYGSDLLALPGRIDKDSWGFVCPKCGVSS